MCGFHFYSTPLKHQREAFDRFKEADKGFLFWEMGLGKTKTMQDLCRYKYDTGQVGGVLLLAPDILIPRWQGEERQKHMGDYPCECFHPEVAKRTQKQAKAWEAFMMSCHAKGMPFLGVGVQSLAYPKAGEYIEPFLKQHGRCLIVVDEGTYIKNTKSLRWKHLDKYTREGEHQKFLLTGTALAKSPVDVYGMAKWVDTQIFPETLTAFTHKYLLQGSRAVFIQGRQTTIKVPIYQALWDKIKTAIGKLPDLSKQSLLRVSQAFGVSLEDVEIIARQEQLEKVKHLDELKSRLAPYASFLQKKDVLDLPEKRFQEVRFPLPKAQKECLKSLSRYGVSTYEDDFLTLNGKSVLLIKALQIAGGFFPGEERTPFKENPKLDFLLDSLMELGEQQAIIWACFVPELHLLHERVSKITSCSLLCGDVSAKDRDKIVSAFQKGDYQILIANPTVAGYGLNLQCAGIHFWYSRTFRTEARLQAEDRSYRIGTKEAPLYIDLLYDTRSEQAVLESNRNGKDMNDFLNSCQISDIIDC